MRTLSFLLLIMFLGCVNTAFATEPTEGEAHGEDPIEAMMHHLGDANEFHIMGSFSIPLPCMAWSDAGFMFTLSSSFEHGHKAVNGYVLNHGVLMRIKGEGFPKEGSVDVTLEHTHEHDVLDNPQVVDENGVHRQEYTEEPKKAEPKPVAVYNGTAYELEPCMSLQNPSSSWQDFSISKNVFAMLLALLLLVFVFSKVSKAYVTRKNEAPKGLQSFMEPIIVFMRDQVARPAIGEKHWKRFFPFIMSLFFFILFCNLLGLIPFFPGSANVTGNIGVTMVLALFVFVIVNINGTKDYWMHIFWMPGVPTAVKPLLTVIEVMSLFIKPATLFIRLFANMTAGHIIILSLVSLIFFFNNAFGVPGAVAGMTIAIPFVFAMNMLELFVAFLQAFVFALLASLYIGSALEEHHHEHEHGHEHDHGHGAHHH